MSTLGRTRIRLAGDAANFNSPLDANSRATPQFWRGNDVQFEIAVFFNGALQSIADLASVTLEIRAPGSGGGAPDPSTSPLMSATVNSGALDDTLTGDTWSDGSKQHALIAFTAAQSNIAAGPQWLSLWVVTTDSPGRVITLAAGPIRVQEDGAGLTTTPPTPDDTYYTAAQSDARYLAVDNPTDAAASRALLGLGTAATHDVPASGNASSSQAVLGNDTRLSDSRTPTTHASTHASGGGDALTLAESQVTNLVSDLAAKAPLASPVLTGTPTAPTPSVDDNSTKLATTAFVLGQASASGDGTPAMNGTAARGSATHFARADHVHPSDTSRAPLASPALTGSPTAPTPSVNDNSTKLATTAFTQAQNALFLAAVGQGALSFDGNSGTVLQSATANANLSFVDGSATFRVRFYVRALQQVALLQKKGGGSAKEYEITLQSDGSLLMYLNTSGSAYSQYSTGAGTYAANQWNELVVTVSNTTISMYVNGQPVTVTTANFGGGFTGWSATSALFSVGDEYGTYGTFFRGEIALAQAWNRCLSSAEVLNLFAGAAPVDFADQGASQTALSSGSLTVGKRYRIGASGGTFTGVGAANNTVGTEFIATGTSPTWSTGSLVQIGCVGNWGSEGLGPTCTQWLDHSGNAIHLLYPTAGVLPTRYTPRFKFVWTISAGAFLGGSARAVLPANYILSEIIADTAGTPTLSVGQDATNNACRVASVTLAAGKTKLTLLAPSGGLAGYSGSSQQLYVAMSSGAASTTFTVMGFIAG